eukprot:Awhi_evm2s13035
MNSSLKRPKYSWIVFGFVLLFVLTLNVPFIWISYSMRPNEIRFYITELLKEEGYLKHVGALFLKQNKTSEDITLLGNWTPAELQRAGAELENKVAHFHHLNGIIWKYCYGTAIVHLVIYAVVVLVTSWYKHSKVVRSRGKYFLAQVFICAPLAMVFALFQSGVALFRFPNVNILNANYASIFLSNFFAQGMYSSIINRMRIVYHAFQVKQTRSPRTRSKWLYYFEMVPVQLVIFLVSMSTITAYVFADWNTKYYRFALFCPIFIYPCWGMFYSWKCRNVSIEFNDFNINMRNVTYISGFFLFLIMFDTFDSSVVGDVGYQFAIQSFIVLYLLDVFSSLAYIHYHNEYTRSESQSSKSKVSSLARRIKGSVQGNQSRSLMLVTETINEAEQEEKSRIQNMVSIYDGGISETEEVEEKKRKKMASISDSNFDDASNRNDGIDIDLTNYGTVYDGTPMSNSHSDVIRDIEIDLGNDVLTE